MLVCCITCGQDMAIYQAIYTTVRQERKLFCQHFMSTEWKNYLVTKMYNQSFMYKEVKEWQKNLRI